MIKKDSSITAYETVRLETLIPDSANARKHGERNIEEIMRSLRDFGQHAPLVVQRKTNRILVGNGRYEAMLRLGWTEAPVHFVDDDNITAVRRALADNRTAELAEWDTEILGTLVQGLGDDVEVPGWNADELKKLIDSLQSDEESLPQDSDFNYIEKYGVIVECETETQQETVYEELTAGGYKCKVVSV